LISFCFILLVLYLKKLNKDFFLNSIDIVNYLNKT